MGLVIVNKSIIGTSFVFVFVVDIVVVVNVVAVALLGANDQILFSCGQ